MKRIGRFFRNNVFLSMMTYIVTILIAIVVFAIVKKNFGSWVTIILALCVFIFINVTNVRRNRSSIKKVLIENMFMLMLASLILGILLLYVELSNV